MWRADVAQSCGDTVHSAQSAVVCGLQTRLAACARAELQGRGGGGGARGREATADRGKTALRTWLDFHAQGKANVHAPYGRHGLGGVRALRCRACSGTDVRRRDATTGAPGARVVRKRAGQRAAQGAGQCERPCRIKTHAHENCRDDEARARPAGGAGAARARGAGQ
jgi:hypothetical protein